MTDFPSSLIEFQQRFGDEAACAQYLAAARWPDGFVCPGCGGGKAWRLETKAWTYECASCRRQTSVTAGTIMHHSKLPLTAWFWAAYLMATHSNGISALQLQRQLAFGSYKPETTVVGGFLLLQLALFGAFRRLRGAWLAAPVLIARLLRLAVTQIENWTHALVASPFKSATMQAPGRRKNHGSHA